MITVLFACVHNAGRSQMAAALFNRIVDSRQALAISAGTEPGEYVHAEVIAAMAEQGVDLSAARPQRLDAALARHPQLLVTMGCGEACPIVPGARVEDWPLRDPKGLPIEEVRAIRDQIAERVTQLIDREGWRL